ncbi:MAG: hypothetical protein EA369_03950 [Bradymonadales bacterium]|nr:MAG: hypothetical protein EA369_03950 [Bradymonadales bacterium]
MLTHIATLAFGFVDEVDAERAVRSIEPTAYYLSNGSLSQKAQRSQDIGLTQGSKSPQTGPRS